MVIDKRRTKLKTPGAENEIDRTFNKFKILKNQSFTKIEDTYKLHLHYLIP